MKKWAPILGHASRPCGSFNPFLTSCCVVMIFSAQLGHSVGLAEMVQLPPGEGQEFSARLVWKTGGKISKAHIFVKPDRYRVEHVGGIRTDLGYAGVTIVRLDEQKVWYVLSERRTAIRAPLTAEHVLPLSITLDGEQKRTLIGEGKVENQTALLYEVLVRNRFVGAERYFQWVDPDQGIPLKLLSQDRDWFIEFQHVVLSPQPDFFFEPPLGYRVIEVEAVIVPEVKG
jgi:hypothetical protein